MACEPQSSTTGTVVHGYGAGRNDPGAGADAAAAATGPWGRGAGVWQQGQDPAFLHWVL